MKKKEESDDDEEDDEESDEEEESDEGTTCTIKTLCSQFYLKKLDVRPILYNRFYTNGGISYGPYLSLHGTIWV